MKYVPWCFLGVMALFGGSILAPTVYCLVGYYQYMLLRRSFIRVPLGVYRKIDHLMPESVKNRLGYVSVVSVETNLSLYCYKGDCCVFNRQPQNNPFDDNIGSPNRVEVLGGGVQLGGANQEQRNYR